MLVLSRRVGEAIRIGEGIEISIVEVQGDKVRLGITAPKDVRILRRELIEETAAANARSAAAEASLGALAEAFGLSHGQNGPAPSP